MDQVLAEALKVLLQAGIPGICLGAMFYYIIRRDKQDEQRQTLTIENMEKMHDESLEVQRELMAVVKINAVANTRLADMLSDRPCLMGASALKRNELGHIAEDGGGKT